MAVHRVALPLVGDLNVNPKVQAGTILSPERIDQNANIVQSATWVENLWATAERQLAAVRIAPSRVQDLPADFMLRNQRYNLRTHKVYNSLGMLSVCLYSDTEVAVYTGAAWNVLITDIQKQNISVVPLKGTTYFHTKNTGIQRFPIGSFTFDVLEPLNPIGLLETSIAGLSASCGYLLAFDSQVVYWSSPLNPQYWTPDGVGANFGAGSTQILDLRGEITGLIAVPGGFVVLSTGNAISARYTGNPSNPWQFREIANSSRVESLRDLAVDQNSGLVYAVTASGIAVIQDAQCNYVFPELNSAVSSTDYPNWDTVTSTLRTTFVRMGDDISTLNTKAVMLSFMQNTYLIVSYGKSDNIYEYLLIYDTSTELWSRLRYPHMCLMEASTIERNGLIFWEWEDHFADTTYTFEDMFGTRQASEAVSLALVTPEGKVLLISPNRVLEDSVVLPSVIEYGEIAYSRNSDATLTEVTLFGTGLADELVEESAPTDTEVWVNPSRESRAGATLAPRMYVKIEGSPSNAGTFVERVRGSRLRVVLKNTGTLESVEIALVTAGNRKGLSSGRSRW